jgi:nucleoside-diphosphate-sugar epimerase
VIIFHHTAQAPHRLVPAIINIKSEPKMTRFVANELAKSHWFDISAAKNDLGYIPRVSTKEGLKRLEAWLYPKSHMNDL